jgi:hypothetical protein
MRKQKHDRRLPPLGKHRIRRLRARVPLEVLAVKAQIPSASLSRFERGEHTLAPDQLDRLERALSDVDQATPTT